MLLKLVATFSLEITLVLRLLGFFYPVNTQHELERSYSTTNFKRPKKLYRSKEVEFVRL